MFKKYKLNKIKKIKLEIEKHKQLIEYEYDKSIPSNYDIKESIKKIYDLKKKLINLE
jgi:hypothetical protein